MAGFVDGIFVSIGIDASDFEKGLEQAQASMKRVGDQMQAVGKKMSVAITAPIVGFGALTLKAAGDFEAGMNQVRAVSGATGEQFESLRDLAKELGATTQYTAAQAADAMGFLAMAGMEANDILAAMPDTLQLAAAAQLDMASSADIVTNILAGYNRPVEQLAETTDVLVKAFTSANTDLSQLAQAMKYAGPVASAAGVNFEEAAAALSLMGNAGIQGSMAGTSLRGAISRVLNPTKQVAEAMEEAGLSFTNASGKLLPLADIIEELEPHAENAGLFMRLFGQRAGPAMAALVTQGSDAVRELTDELQNSAGTAGDIAAVQMEGFNGAMRQLAAAFEALQLAIADSGLLQWATDAVQALAAFIQEMSKTNPELLKWGTIVAGAAAAIGPLLIGLGFMLTAFAAVSAPVWGAIAAISAISAAIIYFWDDIQPFVTGFATEMQEAMGPRVTAAIETMAAAFDSIRQTINDVFAINVDGGTLLSSLTAVADLIGDRLITALSIALQGITTAVQVFAEGVKAITALLKGDFQGAFESMLAAGAAFKDGLLSIIGLVSADLRNIASQIPGFFAAIPDQMLQIGREIISGLWNGIKERWEGVKASIAGIGSGIADTFRSALSIHSPSRVMHEIGVNTMEGLGLGMESMNAYIAEVSKGIGGTVAKELQSALESTRLALMTDEEAELASHAKRIAQIQEFFNQRMILKAEYDEMMERANEAHSERMLDITRRQVDEESRIRNQMIGNASSVFGSLSSIMESFGEENLAAAKAFAVGQAVINTAQGITKALAQGGMFGFAGAAAVAAAGAAQISTILSAQRGGGRRPSVRSSGPNIRESGSTGDGVGRNEPARQQAVTISIPGGDFFTREQMERFTDELLKMQRDGFQPVLNRG